MFENTFQAKKAQLHYTGLLFESDSLDPSDPQLCSFMTLTESFVSIQHRGTTYTDLSLINSTMTKDICNQMNNKIVLILCLC